MQDLISIEQTSKTQAIRELGEFTVNSGAIRFTDPCYNNDTWCKGSMPAVNGQYQAKIGFFRDSYDETSLKKAIAIQIKAIEIVKSISYAMSCELIKVKENLDKFVKEHNPKEIPYLYLGLINAALPILLDIAKFSDDSVPSYSWKTKEETQLSTLAEILGLLTGRSHHISDSWSYRIAMAGFEKSGEEIKSNEQKFEKVREILLEALNDELLKDQKAFDEGRPRRILTDSYARTNINQARAIADVLNEHITLEGTNVI